jgi:hypothetical protein
VTILTLLSVATDTIVAESMANFLDFRHEIKKSFFNDPAAPRARGREVIFLYIYPSETASDKVPNYHSIVLYAC